MNPARSIAGRLAALFAAAALIVFSLFGFVLDRELTVALRRQQVEQLDTKFQDIEYILKRIRSPDQWVRIHAKLDALTPPDRSTRYWILSDDPHIRYGESLAEIAGFSQGSGRVGELRIGDRPEPFLIRSAYFPANDLHPALRFIVGIDSESYVRTQRAFRSVLLACVAFGVPLGALIGYLITHLGLVPLKRLSREARALSPSTLSQRLMVTDLPEELADLSQSFNGALDRVEAAYEQLESFNADVTHELRTPLTNLIGQTQVALSRQRSADDLVEVLQSNLEDLERLRGIVNDMLFLARADQGERPQHLLPASLAAEVEKSAEFLDFLVEEAGVRIRVQGDALAPIERSLFRRAVTNLLHNAIRHADTDSEILVQLTSDASCARIAVSNHGPEIPSEHLTRLFDRFYRVDMARANSGESHGLGLAIVKAVAAMHSGSVFATSEDGVTTIGFSVSAAL
ncbi:MAG TPA: heavy metal sensor histidine kinase [Noviherbaspirillum sp.]|uniref:heavy metal sensor histidine kinase n=1 Tax=Noviherbaspirillum sp. TaxID=1926288 RepID=UPI002B49622B|nr:heavy metal sensor histidine kinase [Noviherbaspirillum sp.]HJV84632.1 heavy metal sensor histidine kinase [Noviherbaspirillum sp.]